MSWFQLFIVSLPSFAVCYLMLCLINARKQSLFQCSMAAVRAWAYLGFLGGAIFTWYLALRQGKLPHWDKILMDIAACLYFTQRAWRVYKWRHRHD